MKKKNFHLFYGFISLNGVVFSFKIYFSISFCSDFNVEATVANTDEIRGLKQFFTLCFLVIGKKNFFQNNNNYRIAHQKNHVKNNDRTFN